MPKVSDEYIRVEFYARFATMPASVRVGVIEGLRTAHEVMLAKEMFTGTVKDRLTVEPVQQTLGEQEG